MQKLPSGFLAFSFALKVKL